MGKFKKGDWVRRTDGSSMATLNGSHEAGFVGQVADVVEYYGQCLDFTNGHRGYADNYEPWRPKVGERVRLVKDGKSTTGAVGKNATVSAWSDGSFINNDEYLIDIDPPVDYRTLSVKPNFTRAKLDCLEPLLTPEQPILKIEAGRFYKTRDGRKVGPMIVLNPRVWTFYEVSGDGRLWQSNGTGSNQAVGEDLIAEWIDEPAAKAKPSNDNAQPKFKVGDVVTPSHGRSKDNATVTKIKDGRVSVRWNNDAFGSENGWREDELTIVTPPKTTTAIVALIENGQPKPSSTPHLHATTGAAEREAKRLAAKFKGKQFGVFTLTTTHEEAAPVYDHKWQNLAVLGLKIDAIKELRAVAGLTLKGAKDAVDAWIEYENAA